MLNIGAKWQLEKPQKLEVILAKLSTVSQNVASVWTRGNNTMRTRRKPRVGTLSLTFFGRVDIHQLVQLLVSPLCQSETELYSHPSQNQRLWVVLVCQWLLQQL